MDSYEKEESVASTSGIQDLQTLSELVGPENAGEGELTIAEEPEENPRRPRRYTKREVKCVSYHAYKEIEDKHPQHIKLQDWIPTPEEMPLWQTSPILGLEKDILLMVTKQLWKLMDLREEVTRRGCGGMSLETRENKEESITGKEVKNLITQILLLLIDVPGMRDTRFLNCPHSLLPLTSNAELLKHCLMAGKWSPKAEMIILAAERSEH
nr:bel3 protein [Human spumaretrovirus]